MYYHGYQMKVVETYGNIEYIGQAGNGYIFIRKTQLPVAGSGECIV